MRLAIDIGGSNARYAEGSPASHDTVELDRYDSSMSYEELLTMLQSLVERQGPRRVGVSVPGPIYPPGIVSPSKAPSPNISWDDAPLQDDLDRLVEPLVKIQRDLYCAAQGILQIEDTSSFTLLYPGTGFGYATAIDGTVITGTKNTAGELATATSSYGSYDEALCLSAMVELDEQRRTPKELLRRREEPAQRYLNRLVELTSPLIRTTASPTIFIGGHLTEYWGDIHEHLRKQYRLHLPYEATLRRTDVTPLVGAFTLGSGNIHF